MTMPPDINDSTACHREPVPYPPIEIICDEDTHGQGTTDPEVRLPDTYPQLLKARNYEYVHPHLEAIEEALNLPRPIFPLCAHLTQPRLSTLTARQAQAAMAYADDLAYRDLIVLTQLVCNYIAGRTKHRHSRLTAWCRADMLASSLNPEEVITAKEIGLSWKDILTAQPNFTLDQKSNGDVILRGSHDRLPYISLTDYHEATLRQEPGSLPADPEDFLDLRMSALPDLARQIERNRALYIQRHPLAVRFSHDHIITQTHQIRSLRAAVLRDLRRKPRKTPARTKPKQKTQRSQSSRKHP